MRQKIDWKKMHDDLSRSFYEISEDLKKVKPDKVTVSKKPPRIYVTFHLDELDGVIDDFSVEGEEEYRRILKGLGKRTEATREIMRGHELINYGSRFSDFGRNNVTRTVVHSFGYDKKNYIIAHSRWFFLFLLISL